jgi:hypothetical protein
MGFNAPPQNQMGGMPGMYGQPQQPMMGYGQMPPQAGFGRGQMMQQPMMHQQPMMVQQPMMQ